MRGPFNIMGSNGKQVHGGGGGQVQSALPGFDADPQPTDRLFFGLYLTQPVAPQVGQLASRLRLEHGLSGMPLLTERLHVTLYHLGDFAGLPPHIVAMAKDAADALAAGMQPFEITFDRAASFSSKPGNHPYVLLGGDGIAAVVHFQQALRVAMAKAGLKISNTHSYTPHVTLLYDAKSVEEHAVAPVSWTVNEFVLVHSLLGATKHVPLARWALRG